MTDRPIQQLAALLNEPEASDPNAAVRRAELAEAIRAAMARSAEPTARAGQDPVTLAAHLAGGLSEVDRQAVLSEAALSPEALADLEASAALLETVSAHPQPVSAAQTAQARAIFGAAQPVKRSRWAAGFKAVSPLQLGFSFAALAAVAMLAIFTPLQTMQPQPGPSLSGTQNSGGLNAFLPTDSKTTGSAPSAAGSSWRGADAPAPGRSQGWTAVAISSSSRVYGTAVNWPTEAESKLAALATCIKQQGKDCTVAATANGQCISAAGLREASPTIAQSDDRTTAERKALETCGGGACFVVTTGCSGNSPP